MHPLPLCIAAFAWTLLGASCQSAPAPHGEPSIIYLKHVAADDMAETLHQFLSESGQDLEITPHADSNSLLVRASGERWRQLATLIDKLDQPQR